MEMEHCRLPGPRTRLPYIGRVLFFLLAAFCCRTSAMEFIVLSQTSNELYRVTVPLTAPTRIAAVQLGTAAFELIEASPTRLYVFDTVANDLTVLDRFNGEIIRTTPLDQDVFSTRRGFDRSPDGVLYGVLPGMQLRTIDPLTGTTTFIANITGAARVEAIAFAPDGTLYAAGSIANNSTSETLFSLSTTTGELTPIGLMNVVDVDDLTFGSDGFLYGVDSQAGVLTHLLKIDPATAVVEDMGSTGGHRNHRSGRHSSIYCDIDCAIRRFGDSPLANERGGLPSRTFRILGTVRLVGTRLVHPWHS